MWVLPYVLALLCEYVLEIHRAIERELTPQMAEDSNVDQVRQLPEQNPGWWRLPQSRVVSYWAEYHRHEFPMLRTSTGTRRLPDAYPAANVMRRLADTDGVKHLQRPLQRTSCP
ncbi:MAG: hypothetical protein GY925_12940 [Actinomycetia bacterium]|nr:hypothetical protein [Actinomycetes bacterium]